MVEIETKFINVKLQVVKEISIDNGGSVIVYLATSESILNEFYIVTFDDGLVEVAWGLGDTIEYAIKDAERQWDDLKDDLELDNENPFTEALRKLQQVIKDGNP
jgi:hypothetical protein